MHPATRTEHSILGAARLETTRAKPMPCLLKGKLPVGATVGSLRNSWPERGPWNPLGRRWTRSFPVCWNRSGKVPRPAPDAR